MDCCIDGDDGPLDLAAMADLVAVIKGAGAEGSRTGSSVTALRAMKRHLIPRVLYYAKLATDDEYAYMTK